MNNSTSNFCQWDPDYRYLRHGFCPTKSRILFHKIALRHAYFGLYTLSGLKLQILGWRLAYPTPWKWTLLIDNLDFRNGYHSLPPLPTPLKKRQWTTWTAYLGTTVHASQPRLYMYLDLITQYCFLHQRKY